MRSKNRFYPPSPTSAPEDLLQATTRYRLQVAVVLLSLLVFLVFYGACVLASGWMLFEAATYPVGSIGIGTVLLKIGACFMTGMLFVFLVKGLFKIQRDDRSGLVEVTEQDEPKLFAFLHRLTAETGAPMPKHVYLSAEVNAAVFYDHSVLSLFLPVQKNLLIGCGLVNNLNMSELKAVLGHELGHFSQSSMRLGSYVYMANRIVHDIVFSRDKWDDVLETWQRQDIRIAIFGWILGGIVWLVRKILQLMFKGMNLLHASLMRQMEFDADKMAVRVAGSDAIVHSLVRSRFADMCLQQTFTDLRHARDHGLMSRDLFVHQTAAADYLRRFHKKPQMGTPEGIGEGVRVFDPNDPAEPPPSMWASHPPDAEREANAKARYLRCKIDERSAWELFGDAQRVREKVTRRLMEWQNGDRPVELLEPSKVQAFIDEERAETTFDPRYHDMYEGRAIAPGDLDEAFLEGPDRDGALAEIEDVWSTTLETFMAAHRKRMEDANQIVRAMGAGGNRVQLRGEKMSKSEAEDQLQLIDTQLGDDRAQLAGLDQRVLRAHVALAKHLDREDRVDFWANELRHRYEFQLGLQWMSAELMRTRHVIEDGLAILDGGGRQLDQASFQQLSSSLDLGHRMFSDLLEQSRSMIFPELKNMPTGRPLREFVLQEARVPPNASFDRIDGAWIQHLMAQMAEVDDKLQRLFFKSIGGLLTLQEEIVTNVRERE